MAGRFNREGTHILAADPPLLYARNQHNAVKQLSPMKTKKLRKSTVKERRLKSGFFFLFFYENSGKYAEEGPRQSVWKAENCCNLP